MYYFLIPSYNESENIPGLLVNVSAAMKEMESEYTVVFVDDGSTDNSLDVIKKFTKKMKIEVIVQPRNMGVAVAFDTGFRFILGQADSNDRIITMEADNTSDIKILEAMIEKSGEYDLVLASCYMNGGGVVGTNLYRKMLSFFANTLLKLCLPSLKGLHTFSSFYRVYRVQILKDAYAEYGKHFIEEPGFVCVVEILYKLARQKIKITEIPMVLDGTNRLGKSKMKVLKTIKGYLRLIFTKLLRDILSDMR